jgi:hypothetical protein
MENNVPLLSLLMALRSGGHDPFAALRGDSDPFAALRGQSDSLAALLKANPNIRQMAPAQAQSAMYAISEPAFAGSQTP